MTDATFFVPEHLVIPDNPGLRLMLTASAALLKDKVRRLRGWVEAPHFPAGGYFEPARAIAPDRAIADQIILDRLLNELTKWEPVDIHRLWSEIWKELKPKGGFSPEIFHDCVVAIITSCRTAKYCLPLPHNWGNRITAPDFSDAPELVAV